MTELEKALVTLREECESHENCNECPLYINNDAIELCYLRFGDPSKFKLKCDIPNDNKVFII